MSDVITQNELDQDSLKMARAAEPKTRAYSRARVVGTETNVGMLPALKFDGLKWFAAS